MRKFFHPLRWSLAALTLCATPAAAEPIRLGWQTPWATQGQLVMALKHSNIAELTGVELDFTGFSYGGPLNRAALAGRVDVLLTADQPALALMSRSDDYDVVARMMYNRVCLYVPAQSALSKTADLAGERVSGPVGAAAERFALAAMQTAGVDLDSVRFGALDMARQTALVSAHGPDAEAWPGVDALYGFDPVPAILETQGLIKILECGNVVSVVVASREMQTSRRAELAAFLRAFALAWRAFADDPEGYNALFSEDSRLNASQETLDLAASVEPNRAAETMADIRLNFTDADHATMTEALTFLQSRGVIPENFVFEDRLRLEILTDAVDADALEALFQDVRLAR